MHRHLRQLFGPGSGVGLTDSQLLDRFASAARRGKPAADDAEAAFETILARHGPTVLSVCRQVLGAGHAAEDAFQATFLVLVRRATSLRMHDHGSLAHGSTASRTVPHSRCGSSASRRLREQRMARPEAQAAHAVATVELADVGAALHAEVTKLPAKYRVPVVLCYFEGRTHDETAAALSWPVGTVRCRLSRARDLLRARLIRRGLAPASLAGTALPCAPHRPRSPRRRSTQRSLLPCALRRPAPQPRLPASFSKACSGEISHGGRSTRLDCNNRRPRVRAPRRRPRHHRPRCDPPRRPTQFWLHRHRQSISSARTCRPTPCARLGPSGFRHGDLANQVLFSRDGKTLITLGWKRVVCVWDAATGRLRDQLPLSGDLFDRIAISTDGATLATTEPDPNCRLRFWDVATGRERRRWHLSKDHDCTAPSFSPDGGTLITLGRTFETPGRQYKRSFELWDLTAPTERLRQIVGNGGSTQDFQISPDGKTLAAITSRDVKAQEAAGNYRFGLFGSPAEENEIRILDLATSRDLAVLCVEAVFFLSIAFSPDGQYLATALADGTVRIYNATTGQERLPRVGRTPAAGPPPAARRGARPDAGLELIDSLAFAPDGSILAGGSSQGPTTPSPGALYMWDFASGRELRRIGGFRVGPTSLSFAPDGKSIATAGSWEPLPRIWDIGTGREAFAQPGHVMGISTLAVSPADGTIFTGSYDGTVRHWDPTTGRELGEIARFNSVLTLAVAPDGQTLIVGGQFGDPALSERARAPRDPPVR